MPDGSTINLSPRCRAALKLAGKGTKIIPCLVGGKDPVGRLAPHGYLSGTTDAATITAWWLEADYNLGVPMRPNGWTALDPDRHTGDGIAEWAEFRRLHNIPDTTRRHATPGDGEHWIYKGLVPSQSKLGKFIDTRCGGYILWPPSVIDGKPYRYLSGKIEPLPAAVAAAIGEKKSADKMPPDEWDARLPGFDTFLPWPSEAIIARLNAEVPDRSVALATVINALFCSGYTPRQAADLLIDHIDTPLCEHYTKNGRDGERAVEDDVARLWLNPNPNLDLRSATEIFAGYTEAQQRAEAAVGNDERRAKFRLVNPSEAMRRRPPEYWDNDKLFLRSTGGSASICYASYSNFKTTFCAGRALAIAKATGARILYIVGEGADGFGPLTLQAAVKDWNDTHPGDTIAPDWLDAHLQLVEVPPQILAAGELEAVRDACAEKGFHPSLIFFDTLGSVAAGQNLSAIEVGTAIGRNVRAFCRDVKADCWLIHHLGKDETLGPTGSRYFLNDADLAIELAHDPDREVLTVSVEKDRWGKKGRKVRFGTRVVTGLLIEGQTATAQFVAVHELAEDDPRRHATTTKGSAEDKNNETRIRELLALRGAYGRAGITNEQLARALTVAAVGEEPPGGPGSAEHADWLTEYHKRLQGVRDATSRAKWAKPLYAKRVLPGGSLPTGFWALPESERPAPGEEETY